VISTQKTKLRASQQEEAEEEEEEVHNAIATACHRPLASLSLFSLRLLNVAAAAAAISDGGSVNSTVVVSPESP
jgi:hypothetical protein